jgi:aminoglycoside 2'-N-acetyltransferase I
MRIVSYLERDVPRDLRLQMVALQDQAWPPDRTTDPAPWHDPALDPLSVLVVDDDTVLSALDILSKPITHASETFAASGISAMVTDQRVRGMGHGRALARAALELMREMGADLGIFTCDTPLQRFYEGAGWQYLPGTVLIGGTPEDPFPSDRFDKVTMASFFTEKAKAAQEHFVAARIELYPGRIDRLW